MEDRLGGHAAELRAVVSVHPSVRAELHRGPAHRHRGLRAHRHGEEYKDAARVYERGMELARC